MPSFLAFILLIGFSPSVLAAPVSIEVNPICCTPGYAVYGDEQPQSRGKDCVVTVDIAPPEAVVAAEAGQEEEPGFFSGVTGVVTDSLPGAAKSSISLFLALFQELQKLVLKEALIRYVPTVFKGHTGKYHAFLDENIFGKSIAQVAEYDTSAKLNAFLQSQEGECSEENPKPNCVVERALCSYEKYVGVLFHQAGQNIVEQAVETEDLQTILATLQKRDQALFEEAVHAQQALDTAMVVYSQYFQTYRLHLKFKEVIEHLVMVRNVTSSLLQLVTCIPNKFVGVATTKCN